MECPGRAPSTPTGSARPRSIRTPRTPCAPGSCRTAACSPRRPTPRCPRRCSGASWFASSSSAIPCRPRRRGSTFPRRRRPCPRAPRRATPSRRTQRPNPRCASCHTFMDTIGLGFGHFDASGKYPATDANGRPDPGATFPRSTRPARSTRSSPGNLSPTLAGPRPRTVALAASAVVRQYSRSREIRYALGRVESNADACSAQRIFASFASSAFNLQKLVVAVVRGDTFRYRTGHVGRECVPMNRLGMTAEVPQAGRRLGAHLSVLARAPELRGQHEQPSSSWSSSSPRAAWCGTSGGRSARSPPARPRRPRARSPSATRWRPSRR